jgi:alkylation response protein AidB-like acyl-CoA dehydrogenase
VLCRTGDEEDRHNGLSQLIIDLRSDGLSIRPIPFLDGRSDFTEVSLEEVFVPDELVLGATGQGWAQNTSELAFERGGPERWLSTYLLVEELVRERGEAFGERALLVLGDAVARWWGLRRLSLSVARTIDRGEAPAVQSALVKEMGTRFEQDLLTAVQELVDLEPLGGGDSPGEDSPFERLLVAAVLTGPSFTIRGGTNEILRSVAAKGLGAL